MVSINTSASFLGPQKSEEPGNENDMAGLENLFASILTVIEDRNATVNNQETFNKPKDVASFLKQLGTNLEMNHAKSISNTIIDNKSGTLSSNMLQIYQTYKTLINDAIETPNDSTISFDLDKLLQPLLAEKNFLSLNHKKNSNPSTAQLENFKNIPDFGDEQADSSIQELSEFEMQRLKSSMKQNENLKMELENNNKKKNSIEKTNDSHIFRNLSNESMQKSQSTENRSAKISDRPNADMIKSNHSLDPLKVDGVSDQGQSPGKSGTNRGILSSENLQTNPNSSETHLKLLEKSWGKDLAKIIEKAFTSGNEKIDINLDPQKLGKMHVTLSIVNNQTSISINTENVAASLILTSAEDRLAQMFEAAGYKLSNFQANSNGKNGSNKNGSGSKQNGENKINSNSSTSLNFDEKQNNISYTIDGRKIINIIA